MHPSIVGTLAIVLAGLVGIGLSTSAPNQVPSEMSRIVAIAWLGGIAASILFDWLKGGLRNLMRLDIFAFISYFFLTYFEMLFHQPYFDLDVIPVHLATATQVLNLGLIGMAVGRHVFKKVPPVFSFAMNLKLTSKDLFILYLLCFSLAYLHQWLAVGFNFVAWIDAALGPRFTQPWGRAKFGSISTLLNELYLLVAVVPPLAGLFFSNWKKYSKVTLVIVGLTCLLNFFFSFIGGTRNVLAVQMAGFLGGYFVSQEKLKIWKLGLFAILSAVLFTLLADHMLSFRNMGFKRYIEFGHYKKDIRDEYQDVIAYDEPQKAGYSVDRNLLVLSKITEQFPDNFDYLGLNLPYVAATKPIPRAFWPGKPEDLKVGIEESLGASGFTLAVTFAGEAYMSGGLTGALLGGMFIGMFAGFWNQFGTKLTSVFPLLLFASGFPPVMGYTRSTMFFTTTLLPAVALVVFGYLLHSMRKG